MSDETEARRAAKLRALKSGCCMWSPILPPVEQNTAAADKVVGSGAGTPTPVNALHVEQADPVLAMVD
jgi:hypothetical protein